MVENVSTQLIHTLRNLLAFSSAPLDDSPVIETHISWVVLTGQYAYKIKKPVKFEFVDFSNLSKREFFCREELRLNRRLAPSLYLDTVAITGTVKSPRIGGTGPAIEFAVKMKQFPQEALLTRQLEQGNILPHHIDSLAQVVAEFHSGVDVAAEETPFGKPEAVRRPMMENFSSLLSAATDQKRRTRIERLQSWSEREFEQRRVDFQQRNRMGFVRECHGDMHLGNMVLIDDEVVIFDCIEFNENLRWIDVMSEVAFVVMDLENRGRADLACRFLNSYLERTGDYNGLIVLPYYMVYRALVRAKIDLLRLRQHDVAPNEKQRLPDDLLGYLQQAERYTSRPSPLLIVTHGVSGSGKTSGTQALIERLGAVRIRSDVERKRLFELDRLAYMDSAVGEDIYSAEANRQTYDRLAELAEAILKAGFPAIVDATFLRRIDRDHFRQLGERCGVPFVILAFDADETTLRKRVAERMAEARDASEANLDVLSRQLQLREPLDDKELEATVTVRTGRPHSADALIEAIEKRSREF